MKNASLLIALLSLVAGTCDLATLQAQTGAWVEAFGGAKFDQGNGICLDRDGNLLITGSFSSDFAIQGRRVSTVSRKDIFLAKFDTAGVLLWIQHFGGPRDDRALAVAVDTQNNIWLTGSIGGDSVKIGRTWLYSNGYMDILVAKFDPQGKPIWARTFGGVGVDEGTALTIDTQGNAYVTGWFRNRVSFDAFTFTAAGEYDMFLIKLDGRGRVVWANCAGGVQHDYGYGVALDLQGNCYVTGRFHVTAFFDADSVTSAGDSDIFIARYNPRGKVDWVRRIGGTTRENAHGLVYDPVQQQLVLTGSYTGEVMLEPLGQVIRTTHGNDHDLIVAAFTPVGALKWVRTAGSPAFDQGENLALDAAGNIYVAGLFSQTAYFDTLHLASRGDLDGFVARYAPDGNLLWVAHAGGGAEEDSAFAVMPDPTGRFVYLTGSFRKEARFRSGGQYSAGDDDAFVQRLPGDFERGTLSPATEAVQFVGHSFKVDIHVQQSKNVQDIAFQLAFSEPDYFGLDGTADNALIPGPYLGTGATVSVQPGSRPGVLLVTASRSDVHDPGGQTLLAQISLRASRRTPFDLETAITASAVDARDYAGSPILLAPTTDTTRFVGIGVWPGDTNNDGIVNEADVLPIGQFFGANGPERPNRTLEWREQLTIPWARIASTYADADGDSVVGSRDVFVVGLNWLRTRHTTVPARAPAAKFATGDSTAKLYLRVVPDQAHAQKVWFEIHAEHMYDLFGLAFDVVYPVSSGMHFLGSDIGAFFGDAIFLTHADTLNGVVSLALSRKGAEVGGVSGSGVVARIGFHSGSPWNIEMVPLFSLQNITAIDSRGSALPVEAGATATTTGVAEDGGKVPAQFWLHPNFPNPFNPETIIRYELPTAGDVRLLIFDNLGRHIRTLVNERQPAGSYSIRWDGHNDAGLPVASGTYLLRLHSDTFLQIRQMTLIR